MAGANRTSSGSFAPFAFAASSASVQPPTAPGTVSAASGPRGGIVSCSAIKLKPRRHRGGPGRHDRTHASVRLAEQPEPVAADMVHVRVDGGDRGGHGHHRFERVAALGENRAAGFHGVVMRRADDAAAMTGAVQIDHAQATATGSANPRLRSSASALGSRPRKAL